MNESEKINQTFELKYKENGMNEVRFQRPDLSDGFYALSLQSHTDVNVYMRWRTERTGQKTDKWRFENRAGSKIAMDKNIMYTPTHFSLNCIKHFCNMMQPVL